jgi:hypothetical protein
MPTLYYRLSLVLFDSYVAHDLAPFHDVVPDKLCEAGRRRVERIGPLSRHQVLELARLLQTFDLRVQLVDDRRWCPGGREQPDPYHGFVTCEPCGFLNRRVLRGQRRALATTFPDSSMSARGS